MDMSALRQLRDDMQTTLPAVPCHVGEPDLWFAENPVTWSAPRCCARTARSVGSAWTAALDRQEPWGVWGGEIFDRGAIVARKRPRGRPRKRFAHARTDKRTGGC